MATRPVLVVLLLAALFAGCGNEPASVETRPSPTVEEDDRSPQPTTVPTRDGMLIVFLDDEATPSAIAAIRQQLEAHVGVGNASFFSKEDAHAEFSAMFRDEPDMVAKTSPAQLPRSLRVRPPDREAERTIADSVAPMEGVKAVVCAERGQCD